MRHAPDLSLMFITVATGADTSLFKMHRFSPFFFFCTMIPLQIWAPVASLFFILKKKKDETFPTTALCEKREEAEGTEPLYFAKGQNRLSSHLVVWKCIIFGNAPYTKPEQHFY